MILRKPEEITIGNMTLKEILEKECVHANLRGADLTYTDLSYLNLRGADLAYASLRGAYLYGVDLSNANLYCADLFDAILSHSDLRGANLSHSDLRGANLHDTVLYSVEGDPLEYRRGKMLTESIIGYKACKVHECGQTVIVTLEIPRGAIVFSINGKKCRTNKAKVLRIGDGFACRAYSLRKYMTYYVGDEFTVYDFNCEYNVECGKGIHFFMTKEDAIRFAREYERITTK